MSDRQGTYLLHHDYVSGNCGAFPDVLVNFNARSTCAFASVVWSNGDCRLDTLATCTSATLTDAVTAFTTQETKDGSLITGEVTYNFSYTNGGLGYCVGTYRITYTRQ